MSNSEKFRNIVAQGWTLMFIVFVANLTMDIVRSMLSSESTKFAEHMGLGGIQFVLGDLDADTTPSARLINNRK